MDRIKVCHIITKLEMGGAQGNTIYTVKTIDGEKYDAFLVTGEGGRLDPAVRAEKFRTYFLQALVREISPLRDIAALLGIYKILKKENPDIVHTHSSKAGILGRWAAHLAGTKTIIHTFHGFGFNDWQSFPVRAAYIISEKLTSLVTDYFIAVSNENIKTALKYGIVKENEIELIHSGIDPVKFTDCNARGALRRELSIPADAVLIGMVSCLKPQKAPLDFVEISQNIATIHKNARFFISGEGMLRPRVSEKIKECGLEGRFFLLGDRLDIENVICSADILVLTSLWEGLPRVVLESKAAGIPMVASAVDGTKEAITDGVDGFLVEPRDVEGFTKKILALIDDSGLRQRISAQAKKSFLPGYDIKNMVINIEVLYKRLIKM